MVAVKKIGLAPPPFALNQLTKSLVSACGELPMSGNGQTTCSRIAVFVEQRPSNAIGRIP